MSNFTPIAAGEAMTVASVNSRLTQLDTAFGTAVGSTTAAYAVTLTAQAASGQKVLLCNAPATVAAGQSVMIGNPTSGTLENGVVASTVLATSITLVANLTSTHAIGEPVANSGAEIVQARAGEATLWAELRKTAGVVASSFPVSPVAGDVCIRSDLGYVRYTWNGTAWLSLAAGDGCEAVATGSLAFGTGSYGAIPFAAASNWDTGAFHSTSVNNTRITIPAGRGGRYLVNFYLDHSVASVGVAYIRKNGATLAWAYAQGRIAGGGETIYEATTPLLLAAGDYLEVMLNIAAGTLTSARFSVSRIGG